MSDKSDIYGKPGCATLKGHKGAKSDIPGEPGRSPQIVLYQLNSDRPGQKAHVSHIWHVRQIGHKETKVDKQRELAQKAADHRKTCQTCTNRHVCDEMAEINLNLLISTLNG